MKKKINIALVQTNTIWNNKYANFEAIEKLINNCYNIDLFLLPEMFDTGFFTDRSLLDISQNNITLEWLKKNAKSKSCAIAGTSIYYENEKFYNRFFFVDNNTDFLYYDKRHLFSISNEDKVVEKGNKRTVVEYLGWRFNLLICYDLRFPVWARYQNDYDVIVYPANWPISRIEQWKALLIARAIENQAYVFGINRTGTDENGFVYNGCSMIVNPKGDVILILDKNEQVGVCEIDFDFLQKIRNSFPVLLDADKFNIID